MNIEAGRTFLHYRLVEKIGEGGMGTVWKAVDESLAREVAIKVLPAAFSADPERIARFEREAKLLAALHHPNIASIFGLHESQGLRFLAMEYVPGDDLAQRLAQGGLPVADALETARQIAEALETAHEQGIVHRDLKPGNVMLTPQGKVKVLDFGLAKALLPEPGVDASVDSAHSPTVTSAGSRAGVILGTASYMSPEQARGKPVDRRADIWAFGVMLFEILSGRKLFDGETVSDTLAAVLRADVDLSALPSGVPPSVRNLLARCLDRDPRNRLRDIGEARVALESIDRYAEESAALSDGPSTGPAERRGLKPTIAAAWVLLALIGGAVGAWLLKPEPAPPLRRFSLAPPVGIEGPRLAPRIAPHGRAVAYVADGRLWVQDLDRLTALPVTGGEKATSVAWSPDGSSLAFALGSQLWRAEIGGDPVLIAELSAAIGTRSGSLDWTADDTIVYSTNDDNLIEVSVTGGSPRVLLKPDFTSESDFHDPSALPDGRGVLYVVHRVAPAGIDTIEALADGRRTIVLREEGASFSYPVYSSTGHIVFERGDDRPGIWALPFSLSELKATGEPVLITSKGSRPSVSGDGSLIYSNLAGSGDHQLVFVDRAGTVLERVGEPLQHADNTTLSPDGRHLAVCVIQGKDSDLWIYDLERDAQSRLVHDAGCSSRRGALTWTPEGAFVAFGSASTRTIRQRRADGAGEETTLVEGMQADFSPDGRHMVFVREGESREDLWILSPDGKSEPDRLLATPAREDLPRVSPSGNLMVYSSDETGRSEVYLQPFPSGSGRWQVSTDGGDFPRWSSVGDRLYYVKGEDLMMEVSIIVQPTLQLSRPRALFSTNALRLGPNHGYDVTPDGERFIMVHYQEGAASIGDLTLVTNWTAGLGQ